MLNFTKTLLLITATFFSVALFGQDTPIAAGQDKWLGNIYSNAQLPGFAEYWNQVTPENAGKWGSVEKQRDVYSWTELDAAYALAKDNGFPFRMHVLVWGNQQPSWIASLTPEEQLAEIEEWFEAVATRYPDIDFVEVVNEPLHDPPNDEEDGGYIEALGGSGQKGTKTEWTWVLKAFELAREHFPETTQLMINEYNIVSSSLNTSRYKALIDTLNSRELIDAIGVQAHAFSTQVDASVITGNLNTLAETGLPIQATELDIDGPDDQTQLEDYKRIFPAIWEHEAIIGVTLWGYRPGLWRNAEKAYIIEADGTERPAMTWLRAYVSGTLPDETITGLEETENFSICPNPVTRGTFSLHGIKPNSQVQVVDLKGNKVKEFNIPAGKLVNVDLNVTPGVYLVQVFDGTDYSFKKLVMK